MRTFTCADCGGIFERRTGSQKYCCGCAEKRKSSAYRNKKAKEQEESRRQAHSTSMPMETIGFDTKGKSLALINAEAKALGMSYGKYVCAIRSGSIEQRLIATGLSPQQWRAKLREARKIFCISKRRSKL